MSTADEFLAYAVKKYFKLDFDRVWFFSHNYLLLEKSTVNINLYLNLPLIQRSGYNNWRKAELRKAEDKSELGAHKTEMNH